MQCFRMHLMGYSYYIIHGVIWKCLWTADTMSIVQVKSKKNPLNDKELLEDTTLYVDTGMKNLPASTAYVEELK